jgi:arylsulfatase A-like enzyme
MEQRPNIIWIFGDQHRAQMLGCNGNSGLKTPNIDQLAINGVNFTNAVAGFPLCCPFRGSLLTSQYPHKCVPGHEYQMDPKSKTIAYVFNDAGYDTIYIGKWHLDGFHESQGRAAHHIVPPERRGGFKTWIGYENNNLQWDSWVHGGSGEKAFHYKLDGYETDELTAILLKQLEIHLNNNQKGPNTSDQPFFAVLSVQPPHNPYLAPEEYMLNHYTEDLFQPKDIDFRPNVPDIPKIREQASRDIAGAYAMIENIDFNIGRVMKFLREKNIADNTYIIFFSDHGDMHGSHGLYRKTYPFEESIKIPFIIGQATKTTKTKSQSNNNHDSIISDFLINHVDIAPTTLGLCSIYVPNWMQGHDYSDIYKEMILGKHGKGQRSVLNKLKSKEEPDSAYLQCVILPKAQDSVDKPWRGIITRDGWKYVCWENTDWVMFNLKEDPYELVNHAHTTAYLSKKKELRIILKDWIDRTGDSFIIPNS